MAIKWEHVEGRRYEADKERLVIEGKGGGKQVIWTLQTWEGKPIDSFWTLKEAKAYAEERKRKSNRSVDEVLADLKKQDEKKAQEEAEVADMLQSTLHELQDVFKELEEVLKTPED